MVKLSFMNVRVCVKNKNKGCSILLQPLFFIVGGAKEKSLKLLKIYSQCHSPQLCGKQMGMGEVKELAKDLSILHKRKHNEERP